MKLAPRFALLTLAAALAVAAPAAAQDRQGSVEITPVIGGYFGGTFDPGTLAFYNGEAKASTEVAYGLRLGFNVSSHFQLEASYLQSDPKLEVNGNGAIGSASHDIGKMEIRLYEVNSLFTWGKRMIFRRVWISGLSRSSCKTTISYRSFCIGTKSMFSTCLAIFSVPIATSA